MEICNSKRPQHQACLGNRRKPVTALTPATSVTQATAVTPTTPMMTAIAVTPAAAN
jgi:hypothetical protein